MTTSVERCANCRYRVLHRYETIARQTGEIVSLVGSQCRVTAPVAGKGWPHVGANDWCGDWATIPPPASSGGFRPLHWDYPPGDLPHPA